MKKLIAFLIIVVLFITSCTADERLEPIYGTDGDFTNGNFTILTYKNIYNVADEVITDGLLLYVPFWRVSSSGGGLISSDESHTIIETKYGLWTYQGMSFDSILSRSTIYNMANLKPANQFTIEFWLKLDTGTGSLGEIFSINGNDNSGIQIRGIAPDIYVYTDTWRTVSGPGLASGLWYHIYVQKTTSTLDFYIDNTLISSANGTGTISYNSYSNLNLAWTESQGTNHDWMVKGTIGELRFYNRSLTSFERQWNHNITAYHFE
jgi:hypothetical protein